jgi:hypothetical protein
VEHFCGAAEGIATSHKSTRACACLRSKMASLSPSSVQGQGPQAAGGTTRPPDRGADAGDAPHSIAGQPAGQQPKSVS